jgi:hypothetical protein
LSFGGWLVVVAIAFFLICELGDATGALNRIAAALEERNDKE